MSWRKAAEDSRDLTVKIEFSIKVTLQSYQSTSTSDISQAVTAQVWISQLFVRVGDDKLKAQNRASSLWNVSMWKHRFPLLSAFFFFQRSWKLLLVLGQQIQKSPLFWRTAQCTREVFWASISKGSSYLTILLIHMLFPEGVFDKAQFVSSLSFSKICFASGNSKKRGMDKE